QGSHKSLSASYSSNGNNLLLNLIKLLAKLGLEFHWFGGGLHVLWHWSMYQYHSLHQLYYRRKYSWKLCEEKLMTQEFDYLSLDQLFENPNIASQSNAYHPNDLTNEFGHFNDAVAIRSFLMSVNAALDSNSESEINFALNLFNASDKYPHLKNGIQAYKSKQYQATLYAANLTLADVENDTSVNRDFAFCAACLLIAHSNKFFGNDNAIINVLIKLKTHLSNEVGTPSSKWIKEIFDSFQPYWGDQRYQTAVEKFV
ncbi:MAG: hypothetical protein AAF490_21510, partial [Chloroflexota bacterium]